MTVKVVAAPEFQAEAATAIAGCRENGVEVQSVTQFTVTPTKVGFACRPIGAIDHLDDRVVIVARFVTGKKEP